MTQCPKGLGGKTCESHDCGACHLEEWLCGNMSLEKVLPEQRAALQLDGSEQGLIQGVFAERTSICSRLSSPWITKGLSLLFPRDWGQRTNKTASLNPQHSTGLLSALCHSYKEDGRGNVTFQLPAKQITHITIQGMLSGQISRERETWQKTGYWPGRGHR